MLRFPSHVKGGELNPQGRVTLLYTIVDMEIRTIRYCKRDGSVKFWPNDGQDMEQGVRMCVCVCLRACVSHSLKEREVEEAALENTGIMGSI